MKNSHSVEMSPKPSSKMRSRSFQSKQTREKGKSAVETYISTKKKQCDASADPIEKMGVEEKGALY